MKNKIKIERQHHGIPDEILDGIFAEKEKGQNTGNENIECTCRSNPSKLLEAEKAGQSSDHPSIKKLYMIGNCVFVLPLVKLFK